MTTHDQYGPGDDSAVHETVGAYVLGVLDDAEATAFEEHLAGCQICAVHLEEFSGMEPMLAMLADGPGAFGAPGAAGGGSVVQGAFGQAPPGASPFGQLPFGQAGASGRLDPFAQPPAPPSRQATPSVSVQPSPQLLDRLVDEVAAKRAKRKRRGMYLVAAAAALIVGGPLAAVVATSDDGKTGNVAVGEPSPSVDTANTAKAAFAGMADKVTATDPTTKVTATVAMGEKGWGTDTVLELKNLKGPEKCSLIAVSKTGEEETTSSWTVPAWGYGIPDGPNKWSRAPLYVHGGTAMQAKDIDHFEVRTFDGKSLVKVDA
ncbi:zf-HC2 domain-containing protein [Streptomyces sp. SID1121]|uniref:zf-HC2 domain-containing protein n=1 Tax=Streptomyces sp. SID1121 TaxID=3425888 RepID=UPI004056D76B